MSSARFALGVAALGLALASCSGPACPEGSVEREGRCVALDGAIADGGRDSGADAGEDLPCGVRCTGTTPVCDETSGECVECLDRTHCAASAQGPACVGRRCVECADRSDCSAAAPACVANSCVECEASADCTTATASRCVSGACAACMADEHCAHLAGLGICDGGTCVECVLGSECATGICLRSSRTCAPPGGTTGLCGACARDAECRAGQLCVPMTYDDPATGATDRVPVGSHCLWRQDADGSGAPSGACSRVRPFVGAASVTSVDGVTTSVCTLRVSTCEAHAAFRSFNCMTVDAEGHARCGRPGVPDGVCRVFDAAANLCTIYCTGDNDCRSGVSCDGTVNPAQCAF